METITTEKIVWRVHCPAAPSIDFDLEKLESNALLHLKAARSMAENAYAPYSKFHVGASLEAFNDDETQPFTGCNVENASYGATICAERLAIHSAVAAGFQKFRIIALSTLDTANEENLSLRAPCGMCRQVMSEFFDAKTAILIDGGIDTHKRHRADLVTMDALLPWRFKL